MSDDVLFAGAEIDGYRLEAPIGSGGFGVVWRALDGAAEPVAVKVLAAELLTSEEAVGRFEREVAAIAAVRHPNVVELREAGRLDDGRPYYVMELLSGINLAELLAERGALQPGRALAICEPLAAALDVVHDGAVIHRDIKASNIFLDRSGDRERVVLLDFGIAKLLEGDSVALTRSRMTVGTPAAMAPEQILGQPVDRRTDVYGLGSLVFHMLTGAAPFAEAPVIASRYMHLHGKRPRPSATRELPGAIDQVVVKAMAKDPDARYPSASAAVEALARAVRGRPATAAGAAIRVEVSAPDELLDDPDDALLDDIDAVVPAAAAALAEFGFRLEREIGAAAVFAGGSEIEAAITAARASVDARPGADARVSVAIATD